MEGLLALVSDELNLKAMAARMIAIAMGAGGTSCLAPMTRLVAQKTLHPVVTVVRLAPEVLDRRPVLKARCSHYCVAACLAGDDLGHLKRMMCAQAVDGAELLLIL